MKGATLLGLRSVPIIGDDAKGCFLLPLQELAFACQNAPLKRQHVLQGVVLEILSGLGFPQAGQ